MTDRINSDAVRAAWEDVAQLTPLQLEVEFGLFETAQPQIAQAIDEICRQLEIEQDEQISAAAIAVWKVFPLHMPVIEKIEFMKVFEEIEHKYKGLAAIEPQRRDKILELTVPYERQPAVFGFILGIVHELIMAKADPRKIAFLIVLLDAEATVFDQAAG